MLDDREHVIIVDASDTELGTAPKLDAHWDGALHRAFSIFLVNARGEVLLQRRADGKYHTPGLWTNTCCGHPRPGEATAEAARRRLREEMGIDCELTHLFTFTYRAELGEGLSEHEIDHVFVGRYEGEPAPNPAEVSGWRWVDPERLRRDLETHPERFTPWLVPALAGLLSRPGWREPGAAG